MFSLLKKFRDMVYDLISHRPAATLDLIDANSCENHAESITQLSLSPFFRREYNSITKVISEFKLNGDPKESKDIPADDRTKLFQLEKEFIEPNKENHFCFGIDTTPQPRRHSPKLSDKTIIYHPNQAPGNKPIAVGHTYSLLAHLPEKRGSYPWIAPLDFLRVKSEEKGTQVGLQQLFDWTDANQATLPPGYLCVAVGDSSYSSRACQQLVEDREQEDVVLIARFPPNRNVYRQAGPGRRKYGAEMHLNDAQTHFQSDEETSFCVTLENGRQIEIRATIWRNVLRRGDWTFKGYQRPFDLYAYTIIDCQTQKPLYKKPLWLAAFGKRRAEVSPDFIIDYYRQRTDLEHCFRFIKQNLNTSNFQTPDTKHEEQWWLISLLSYWQLYLAREELHGVPRPWERYQADFKRSQIESSPARVKRCFDEVLNEIGTPAHEVLSTQPGKGRQPGQKQKPRKDHDIIFKGKKSKKNDKEKVEKTKNGELPGSEKPGESSNPQSLDKIADNVRELARDAGLDLGDLIKKLSESPPTPG